MSVEECSPPGDSAFTKWKIIPGLVLAIVLALIAFIAPIAAWFGVLIPEGRGIPDWFMRSGAITAVFAFAAQEQSAKAIEMITPAGFTSLEIEQLRKVFMRPLRLIKQFIFWLAIAGSLIWAYGDLVKAAIQP
ncbi:hypothetical protein ACF8GG_16360 [Pseudomonas sp. yb_1]|uniref:hypothetical protein n=1 Tax=Pseudomonas sp. yb_1 TaxID=3367217 RepID=UPI00370C9321